jgi:uncharacterized protein YkwD
MNEALDAADYDLQRLARAIFHATNDVRRELGLKPFKPLPALDQAADLQASANALSASASHLNVIAAWATPADRVHHVGLTPSHVSENAAALPLLNLDPNHGYAERETNGRREIFAPQTGRRVEPHTYATFSRALVQAWMNSPGHRANIVNTDYQFLGCSARPTKSVTGLQMIACIQVFFTPRVTR